MINGKKETLWGGFVFVCLPEQNGDDAFNGSIFINFTRKTSTAICAETRTQLHSHPHDSHIPLLSPSSSSAAPARLFPSCADFLPHHHDNVIQPLYQNNMTAYVVKVCFFFACCSLQDRWRFVNICNFRNCQSLGATGTFENMQFHIRSSGTRENDPFMTGAVNMRGWWGLLLHFQMQSRDTEEFLNGKYV